MMFKVSENLIAKILTDNEFSMELAKRLGIQQQSVRGLAKRNSSKLTLYEAILFYKERGLTENQIFYQNESDEK